MSFNKKIKKYIILLSLIITLTLLTIFILINREYILNNLSRIEKIEYPDAVFIDDSNNIYFSDKEMTRVIKINEENKIKTEIIGNKREKGFYRVSEIASDREGNIFIINFIYSQDNIYVDKTEVLMFDKDGNFLKSIFDITCKDEKEKEEYYNSFPYAIMGLRVIDNNLYFFSADLTGNLILWWYDKNSDKLKRLNSYPIEKDNSLHKVFLSENGEVFVIKKDGHLYKYDLQRNLVKVNTGLEIEKIWAISESRGRIYISDIFSRKIFSLENNKFQNFGESIETKELYYNISSNKNHLVGIDDFTNKIVVFDNEGKRIRKTNEIIITHSEFILKILMWIIPFITLSLFLYILYFIYAHILGRYISLIAKEIIIFVPILLISLVLTSIRIYNSLFEKYENEIKNELAALAYYGSKSINAENILKINSPVDFNSENYDNLKSELVGILNNYEDKWNQNLFNTIYLMKDNIFYIICNDSAYYGTWYPYTKHPNEHYEVYSKGNIQTVKYKDQHGEYFVGIAPIKDKDEKIVALYEVGFYEDYAKEFYSIFKKKLLVSAILSSLLYILIFIISTYIILKALKKLKNGVKKVTNGHFGTEVCIKRRDEIGDLGNGFNFMSKKLKDYIDEITDLNKNLEKKVEERTKELQIAYKEIEKRNKTIENDIRMASIIQKNMLPKDPPITEKTLFYTIYSPMELMGGDFYDFIRAPKENQIGILISDVSGHGVPAAFITSMIKTLITTLPDDNITPKNFLSFLNTNIYDKTSGNFITAFYALYDEKNMILKYSRASHPEPILIKNSGGIQLLGGKGKLLGVFKNTEFEEYEIKLDPGDKLIFYTDGLTEAINKDEVQFEEKFLDLLHTNYNKDIISLIDIIIEELERHQISQDDDVCIVGMEIKK